MRAKFELTFSLEFARQSMDGRLTLVIYRTTAVSHSLWIRMNTTTLDSAVRNLKDREGTKSQYIGVWNAGVDTETIPGLADWAESIGASAVVWTDLPSKFDGRNGIAPSQEEAIDYLTSLDPASRNRAERYVRHAPKQIRTPYRDAFEVEFGWVPIEGAPHHEE